MNKNNLEYLLNKYEDWEKIASGANGTIYLAKHKLLSKKMAIKFYSINNDNEDRYYEEIIKNSNDKFSNFSPTVVDAGSFYHHEKRYLYSIMPFLKDSITLKCLLNKMKKYRLEIESGKEGCRKKEDIAYMDQLKLNILFQLVIIYSDLLKNNITHGDLHEKNILIKDVFYKDIYNHTQMKSVGQKNLGIINIDRLNLNIIDFGTSYRTQENKDVKEGLIRDYCHLSNLVAQLIKFNCNKIGNYEIINKLKNEIKANLIVQKGVLEKNTILELRTKLKMFLASLFKGILLINSCIGCIYNIKDKDEIENYILQDALVVNRYDFLQIVERFRNTVPLSSKNTYDYLFDVNDVNKYQ